MSAGALTSLPIQYINIVLAEFRPITIDGFGTRRQDSIAMDLYQFGRLEDGIAPICHVES